MTPESEALLNALVPAEGSVTTDHTDAIYDLLEPLHQTLDKAESHFQALDALRRAADRVEDDPTIYGWFERIKQSIEAGRTKAMNAKRALEEISDLCFQLDSYAIHMRETTTRKAIVPEAKVILSKVEHEHLVESTKEANARLADALAELESLKAKKDK